MPKAYKKQVTQMQTHNNNIPLQHCNRVKNANPNYTVPSNHTTRLAFVRDLVEKSQKINIVKSDAAVYMRPATNRKKIYYPDREKAMRALATVFCEHVNIVTHQVQISLRNAADACGLSTISQTELNKAKLDKSYSPKPSISRVSRAFKDMVDLGWIVAHKEWQVWDKHAGQWVDKYFEVTELFFKALGITPERVARQRDARLKYLRKEGVNSGLTAEHLGVMSINEIKERQRLAHYRKVFDRIKEKRAITKVKRAITPKTPEQQRHIAQQRVLSRLGASASLMSLEVFKGLVNQELAQLRAIAQYEPSAPPH